MTDRTRVDAVLGTVIFLILAPGLVGVLTPWWISGWAMQPPILGLELVRWVGGALAAAGAILLLDSFARFALQGLGTPAPIAPTRRLVVTGLYRFVRNPMYLAVLALVVGQGLLIGNWAVVLFAALLWFGFHIFVVAYEEPVLRVSYGEAYTAFCTAVPRWLPRLRPWRGGSLTDDRAEPPR